MSARKQVLGHAALATLMLVGALAITTLTGAPPAAAVSTPTVEVFQPETLAINVETPPINATFIRATFVVAHPSDWSLYQWRYSRRTAAEGVGGYVNVDANRVRTTGIGNGNNYTLFEAEIPMSGFSNWGMTGTVRWADIESQIDLRFRQGTGTTYADLNGYKWTWQGLTETQSSGQEDPGTLYDIFDSTRNGNLGNGGSVKVKYVCDDNDGSGNNDVCDHGFIRVRSVNGGVFTGSNFGSINQLVCGTAPVAGAPCEGSGAPGAFNADDGTTREFTFTPPAAWGRGRWVVEGKFCGEDQRAGIANCVHGGGWQNIGSYYVNDGQTAPTFDTPTFTGGGTTASGGLLRPNTGATVNYPVTAPGGQIIGWDDGNDGTIDAWNYAEGSGDGNPLLTLAQRTRAFNTTGKGAGSSCRIRTQVTDNGGLNAADPTRNTSAVIQGPDCRVNTPPVGANQASLSATKGTALAISLANTDTVDSDPRTCELVSGPGKGSVTGFTSCSVSYTAAANQYGGDSFTYRVLDDHNGVSPTYTVSLTIANRAPAATAQAVSVDAGTSTAITLAGTDVDGDTGLTCTAPTPSPTKGALTGTGCSRTYTSNAGAANDGVAGPDTFGFTVSDAALPSPTANVSITIRNPDLSLTKSHSGRFNPGNGSGTYTLTVANSSNSVAMGTTTLVDTLPAGMTYRSANVGTSGFTCSGTPGVSTTVTCTRTAAIPKPFSDSISITVDVAEGAGSPVSNTATVSNLYELAATAGNNTATDATTINKRPVATGATVTTNVDEATIINLVASDPDGDPLTYSVVTPPAHGGVSGVDAIKQYTPDSGFQGVDSFTYLVTDDNQLSSTPVTVKIYVGVAGLTGTVTSDATTAALGGIEVRLIDNADTANPVLKATAITAANGTYDLAGQYPTEGAVPYGTYVLRFVDPLNNSISEYHLNSPSRTTATNVVLSTSAATVTVDAALVPGARIQGIVRSTASGNTPIDGLQVRLVKEGSPGSSATTTAAGGRYTFELLTAGTYRVWFRDVSATQWISEWSDEQTTQAAATPIVLTVGQQRTLNEELSPVTPPPPADSGTISGQVASSLSGHAPLAGIQVRLYKAPYDTSTATTTDANGNYSFSGLAPGSYKVWYRVLSGNQYVSEYFDNKADLASATVIVLDNTSVIADAELSPPGPPQGPQIGTVSGTVTQLDGTTPIAGIQVRLYVHGQATGSTAVTTGADGSYSFANKPAGDYDLWFRDVSSSLWFSEWNLDKPAQASADAVTIHAGQTTTADARLTAR